MKRTWIIVAIVLGAIYVFPNILFYIEDYQREHTITQVHKQPLVSTEVNNMYLVNQIHFLEYRGMDDEYGQNLQAERSIALPKEVEKMKEFGLIKQDVLQKFKQMKETKEYKTYVFNRAYTYEESYTTLANEMYVGNIVMEAKTNKIIEFYLISDEAVYNDEEIMKKYIQYLGLDVIDDWELTGDKETAQDSYMISDKAQLKVYTSTDRILMNKENGYQGMYRILFRIDTTASDQQLEID